MVDPGNLVDLALDSLGKYIFKVCLNLKSMEEAIIISNRIGNLIVGSVPITLADKMSNTLLSSLDHCLLHTLHSKKQYELCEKVVKSIIHPAVTRIEPGETLHSPELFQDRGFQSICCVNAVINNMCLFPNLKVLNVMSYLGGCKANEMFFPLGLVEFSGLCDNAVVEKLAKSCKFLKVLNVFRSSGVTDKSIRAILKMKHLEKLIISRTNITNKGILRLFGDYIKKYGKSYSLRYLATTALDLCEQLKIFKENLPDLKVILQRPQYQQNIEITHNFNFCNFHNVIGLDIATALSDLKEILENMGSQLMYLSIEVNDENIDFEGEYEISEILPIGQYCSNLIYLKLTWLLYNCPTVNNSVNMCLPGFQNVLDLIIEVAYEFNGEMSLIFHSSILNFLLSQCVNVKKVELPLDWCVYRKYDIVKTAIELGCFQNLELLRFQLCCNTCSLTEVDDDGYDQDEDNEVVQMLVENCPNLRFVIGVPGLDENHPHNTQRLKFSSEFA